MDGESARQKCPKENYQKFKDFSIRKYSQKKNIWYQL